MNQNRANNPGGEEQILRGNQDEISSLCDADPRLHRLNRLATLGMLSAGAAHEIKNALVPVKTFIDLLIESQPEGEMADIVRYELARINSLVAGMLKLCKPALKEFAPVSIHQTIEDSLRLLRHQASGKGISLNKDFAEGADAVLGDTHQLEQVFLNLFINALEAMGESGTLRVSTRPVNGEQIEVSVSDTGIGIAPEDQEQLFRPFFTTKEGGTGLGLVIAREIVTSHNGTLELESEAGQGATFILRFPLLSQAQERSA